MKKILFTMKEIVYIPTGKLEILKLKHLKLIILLLISVFMSEYSLGLGCSGTTATFVPVNPPLPELNCPSYSNSISSSPEACGNQRSEEHTSELQSRPHLVCRLLLEKKK